MNCEFAMIKKSHASCRVSLRVGLMRSLTLTLILTMFGVMHAAAVTIEEVEITHKNRTYEITFDALIAAERQLKGWPPKWKLGLVDEFNPPWRDLTLDVLVG